MDYNDNDRNNLNSRKTSSDKQLEVGAFTAGGAIGGVATCTILGSAGLAIGGTAVSMGLVPFAVVGGVVGLAAYGIKSFFDGE
jgi:hypothetical protein